MLDLKQREKQKKKNAAAAVTRVSNTKAKVSKTTTKMDTPHSEKSNQKSVSGHGGSRLLPLLLLLPPPLTSATTSQAPFAPTTARPKVVRHLPSTILQHCRGETFNFTRFSCYRLVQRSGPTCFDFCLAFYPYAQHVIRYIRSTHRHGHTCFGGEPTGSSSACYQVLCCLLYTSPSPRDS